MCFGVIGERRIPLLTTRLAQVTVFLQFLKKMVFLAYGRIVRVFWVVARALLCGCYSVLGGYLLAKSRGKVHIYEILFACFIVWDGGTLEFFPFFVPHF